MQLMQPSSQALSPLERKREPFTEKSLKKVAICCNQYWHKWKFCTEQRTGYEPSARRLRASKRSLIYLEAQNIVFDVQFYLVAVTLLSCQRKHFSGLDDRPSSSLIICECLPLCNEGKMYTVKSVCFFLSFYGGMGEVSTTALLHATRYCMTPDLECSNYIRDFFYKGEYIERRKTSQ